MKKVWVFFQNLKTVLICSGYWRGQEWTSTWRLSELFVSQSAFLWLNALPVFHSKEELIREKKLNSHFVWIFSQTFLKLFSSLFSCVYTCLKRALLKLESILCVNCKFNQTKHLKFIWIRKQDFKISSSEASRRWKLNWHPKHGMLKVFSALLVKKILKKQYKKVEISIFHPEKLWKYNFIDFWPRYLNRNLV